MLCQCSLLMLLRVEHWKFLNLINLFFILIFVISRCRHEKFLLGFDFILYNLLNVFFLIFCRKPPYQLTIANLIGCPIESNWSSFIELFKAINNHFNNIINMNYLALKRTLSLIRHRNSFAIYQKLLPMRSFHQQVYMCLKLLRAFSQEVKLRKSLFLQLLKLWVILLNTNITFENIENTTLFRTTLLPCWRVPQHKKPFVSITS
jgi:hypothetical protein